MNVVHVELDVRAYLITNLKRRLNEEVHQYPCHVFVTIPYRAPNSKLTEYRYQFFASRIEGRRSLKIEKIRQWKVIKKAR